MLEENHLRIFPRQNFYPQKYIPKYYLRSTQQVSRYFLYLHVLLSFYSNCRFLYSFIVSALVMSVAVYIATYIQIVDCLYSLWVYSVQLLSSSYIGPSSSIPLVISTHNNLLLIIITYALMSHEIN